MEATNTCGEIGEQEYCEQTGVSGIRKSCSTCHPNQHHAQYLTDFHNQDNPTWWQSETMLEGIQWPNQVNLTLKFGRTYFTNITHVQMHKLNTYKKISILNILSSLWITFFTFQKCKIVHLHFIQ